MKDIKKAIEDIIINYMPAIFNICELWNKLQDVYGEYTSFFGRSHFRVSNSTLYRYTKKYCDYLGGGQWELKKR